VGIDVDVALLLFVLLLICDVVADTTWDEVIVYYLSR
jgi:hypothetical protein